MKYLSISDTHVLHVCHHQVDVTAELLKLLLQGSQLLLLAELSITLRLPPRVDWALYSRSLLREQRTVSAEPVLQSSVYSSGGAHLCEGKLLSVCEMAALGKDEVRRGGASEGVQEVRQLTGGAGNAKDTFGRRRGGRAQLLFNAFTQTGQLPGAVLLFNTQENTEITHHTHTHTHTRILFSL